MNSKIKNIIILVVVAVVLVLIYIFFIKKEPTEALITSSPSDSLIEDININNENETPEVSEDFISMLLSIKSIKLEDTIFSDQAFFSLRDSSILLVQLGDEGRPNPFAPIGSESNTIPQSPILPEGELNE